MGAGEAQFFFFSLILLWFPLIYLKNRSKAGIGKGLGRGLLGEMGEISGRRREVRGGEGGGAMDDVGVIG
jgi:hypothetical protein